MDKLGTSDKAGVKGLPPLYFLTQMAIGYGLEWTAPLTLPSLPNYFGMGFVLMGFGVALWAIVTLKKAQTAVYPHHPTTAIVASGPFRVSRNPIYLGFVLITGGVGLLFHSGWILLLMPITILLVYLWVIKREESYLNRKFGEEYRVYFRKTRRWL